MCRYNIGVVVNTRRTPIKLGDQNKKGILKQRSERNLYDDERWDVLF